MSSTYDIGSALTRLTPGRPLLIVDADEVLLRFVDGFDRFLRDRQLFLDLVSYRLHGNVKRLNDQTVILDVEVTALLDDFRAELDSLEIVEGAIDTLNDLKHRLDVVVLTNIRPEQAGHRVRNFTKLGLDLPLVANNGLKGPAVKALAARAGRPAFFVDDIPQNLQSAAEIAPEIFRIHLIGDDRLKPLLPAAQHAHLRADDWLHAGRFIADKLNEAGL